MHTPKPRSPLVVALAACSAGAGVIHLALVPAHGADGLAHGLAFAAAGWFQLGLAVLLLTRPRGWTLAAGAAGNLGVIAAWAASRTVGLPGGAEPWTPEAVSAVDLLATALAGVVVAGCLALFARPGLAEPTDTRRRLVAGLLPALAVVGLTSAALASPAGQHDHGGASSEHSADGHSTQGHEHGGSDDAGHDPSDADETAHEHDESGDVAAGLAEDEHEHATDATSDGVEHKGSGHAHPACAEPVTPEQQEAADDLVAETQAAVAKYESLDVAIADGYRPITPPGLPMVHYGNPALMIDGEVLEPNGVESLMYAFGADGTSHFVGTMYLDEGTGPPPAPGGCLTQWHDHSNLCMAPGQGMVGVTSADGTCPAGSENQPTEEMIHVWVVDVPGGPLASEMNPRDLLSLVDP